MEKSDKILQSVIGSVVVALVVVILLPIVNDFVAEAVTGEDGLPEEGTLYSILEFLPNIIAIVAFVGILGYLTSLLKK